MFCSKCSRRDAEYGTRCEKCYNYDIVWRRTHREYYKSYIKNRRKDEKYRIQYNKTVNRNYWKVRIMVLKKLGAFCTQCKISDIRVLTISHRQGNGQQDYYNFNGKSRAMQFYRDIISGKRQTSDLETKCFNCNIIQEWETGKRGSEANNL